MALINNTFNKTTPVSPAWKKFGSQYKVTPTSIEKKGAPSYAYSPSTSLLSGKPLAPALTTKSTPVAQTPRAQTSSPAPSSSSPMSTPQTSPRPEATAPTVPTKGLLTPPAPTNPTSLGGIVGGLVDRSKTSSEQKRLNKRLEKEAQDNKRIGEEARSISEMYGKEIANLGKLGAGAIAGNLSTGSNVVGNGNAAIASQSVSQRMQALGQAQEAALQGTAQQLTGTEQLTNALTSGIGAQATQQQLGISGLQNAGQLSQPVQVAPGSTLVTPTGGEQVAGGLGGYVNYNTAEQVMGLISQYPDAGYAYNEALTPQQNLQLAQQAIQGSPTYQRSTFGAPGASSYLGGAQLGAAGTLTGDLAQIQAQAGAAEQNFGLLINIASQGGVNEANVPILNTIKRNVERGTASKESVAAFNSAIQSVRAQYASILGGGTPTDASRSEAAQQIPDDVSLSALQTIAETLRAEANNRMTSYQQSIQGLSNQAIGGGGGFAEAW